MAGPHRDHLCAAATERDAVCAAAAERQNTSDPVVSSPLKICFPGFSGKRRKGGQEKYSSKPSSTLVYVVVRIALKLRSLRLNTPVCIASRYFEHKPTSLSHRKAIVAIKVFRQAKRSEKQLAATVVDTGCTVVKLCDYSQVTELPARFHLELPPLSQVSTFLISCRHRGGWLAPEYSPRGPA